MKIFIETLEGMICVLINSKIYKENHGKKNIFIFVLKDLKKGIKEDIVLVRKAKTFILNVLPKSYLSKDDKCYMQSKIEVI